MNNPIVHFEIPADDVERASNFYRQTFGWQINKFDLPAGEAYYGVRTTEVDDKQRPVKAGEINGGLMKRKMPDQPFMNYKGVIIEESWENKDILKDVKK